MGKENPRWVEGKEWLGPSLLVLVRHAQSERNLAKGGGVKFPDRESLEPVQGIPSYEIELTNEGRAQARKTGVELCERFGNFEVIYHSGYVTARQTAEEIAAVYSERAPLNKPRIVQEFLVRERDRGFVYDMTAEEIEAHYPWLRGHWQTFGRLFGKAPGSESLIQVAQRARYFLDELFRFKTESSVLVVTHAGTFQCFRFLMEGWTYAEANKHLDEQRPGNCAVVAYMSPSLETGLHIGVEEPSFISLGYEV